MKLLIPVDGSAPSLRALAHAIAVLRPTQTQQAGSALDGALAKGTPVLLEFQSPY